MYLLFCQETGNKMSRLLFAVENELKHRVKLLVSDQGEMGGGDT